MRLLLFGASSPTAQYILKAATEYDCVPLLTRPSKSHGYPVIDLSDPANFLSLYSDCVPTIIFSLCPVWEFAPFIARVLSSSGASRLNLLSLVVCSSSSVETKAFSSSGSDFQLSTKLQAAEDRIAAEVNTQTIPTVVLRPSLVYGNIGAGQDRNLSFIYSFTRLFPFVLLPGPSGLRQPIHHYQLAQCFMSIGASLYRSEGPVFSVLTVGGDSVITYRRMIELISLKSRGVFGRCRVFEIPARLFFFIISPLLIVRPVFYFSCLRICSNLSGFVPASKLTDVRPSAFPLQI